MNLTPETSPQPSKIDQCHIIIGEHFANKKGRKGEEGTVLYKNLAMCKLQAPFGVVEMKDPNTQRNPKSEARKPRLTLNLYVTQNMQ